MSAEELLERLGRARVRLVLVPSMPSAGIMAPFPSRSVPAGTLLCGAAAYRRMSAALRAVDALIARVFR